MAKILVPNLVKPCNEPYPPKQSFESFVFFSWWLSRIYVLVNAPPVKINLIIFLLPDICTPKENNCEMLNHFPLARMDA